MLEMTSKGFVDRIGAFWTVGSVVLSLERIEGLETALYRIADRVRSVCVVVVCHNCVEGLGITLDRIVDRIGAF